MGGAIIEKLSQKEQDWIIYAFGQKALVENVGVENYFRVDITRPETFSGLKKIDELDAVIHSAGLAHQFRKMDKKSFRKVNVEGTKNILEYSLKKNVRHFVLISSVAVYGKRKKSGKRTVLQKQKFSEGDECFPAGEYAESKLEAEEAVRRICRENGVSLTILRLATVVGEEDPGNLSRLIKAIDKGVFVMPGTGENYKTLIYKEDVARACYMVLKRSPEIHHSETYNIASEPVRMKEIVGEILKKLEKKQRLSSVPFNLVYLPIKHFSQIIPLGKLRQLRETLEKWHSDEIFSNEKFSREFGFYPQTPALEAVGREVTWYRKNKC